MANIPKAVQNAMLLLRALNTKETISLLKLVLYLYSEFYIRTIITPKIESFVVQFKYKDDQLLQVKLKNISELQEVIDTLKKSRGEIIK